MRKGRVCVRARKRMRAGKSARAEERKGGDGKLNRRAAQLGICLALFLTVFVGKGIYPHKVGQAGRQLVSVISLNTDFRGAFVRLGQALSEQSSPALEELGAFCIAVFSVQEEQQDTQVLQPFPEYDITDQFLSVYADQNEMTAQYLGFDELPERLRVEMPEPAQPERPSEVVQPEPEPLSVGDVVQAVSYQGEPLPEHYTMEWLYLGEMETVTPAMGTISSAFGYRDHPTIKRYALHGGVDIAAKQGSTVVAFADGKVEYIGESDDFGLYLQIEHDNGVKTFYAHCSKLLVTKGQQVTAGETVAKIGSTGQSTGPHLHFEIKFDGQRLNPEYYIDVGTGA